MKKLGIDNWMENGMKFQNNFSLEVAKNILENHKNAGSIGLIISTLPFLMILGRLNRILT